LALNHLTQFEKRSFGRKYGIVPPVDGEDVLHGGLEGVATLFPNRERGSAVDAVQLAPDALPLETVRHLWTI